jgi:peptidoglycan/LPS O-acetylase OafA/YrhL
MSTTSYRRDIDGLRAVAVLAVVVYHAWPHALPGGFVGVDVFFVISGFLITRILLAPDFSFIDFYCRRARRLLPALLIVLVATLAIGRAILPPDSLHRLLGHAIGGGLFAANFVSYFGGGYFGGDADLRPLLHLWSLGVEEQFYLVWPAAVWLALRRGRLGWLVAVVAAASLAAFVWLGEHDPRAAFYLPWSRFWELLAGAAMIAVEVPRRWADAAAAAGLALTGAGFASMSGEVDFPGVAFTVPVAGTCLLLAARTSWLNSRVLASGIAVGVGLVSYPLYLWHWPLLALLRNVDRTPSTAAICAVLAAALVLAVLTWRVVERPLTKWPLRRVAAGLVGGLAALVATTAASQAALPHEPLVLVDAACAARYPYPTRGLWFCRLSRDGPPTVLVLGDSHAHHLYEGVANALPTETVLMVGACTPTPGLRFPERTDTTGTCANDNFARLTDYLDERVVHAPTLRWVVLAGMWRTFDDAGSEIDYWSGKLVSSFEPRSPTPLDAYVAAIERQIARLGPVPVTLVLDSPRRGLAVETQRERRAPLAARLRQLAEAHTNVRVFDAMASLCDGPWCEWNRLRDANHLSRAGSLDLGAALVATTAPRPAP